MAARLDAVAQIHNFTAKRYQWVREADIEARLRHPRPAPIACTTDPHVENPVR